VALVEFSDFQCPFCGRFVGEVMPDLVAEYVTNGRVLFAFQHLPLDIHPFAMRAAEAANCAGRQGRFWEMHDAMFARPTELDETGLLGASRAIALDGKQFSACLSNHEERAQVLKAAQTARELKILSTPTFMAGNVLPDGSIQVKAVLIGAKPIGDFRQILDSLLTPQAASQKR